MAVFSGVHAALLTAFDADGALDTRATAALATDLTDRGVHGLVVNGSTGEFASLSTEERRTTSRPSSRQWVTAPRSPPRSEP